MKKMIFVCGLTVLSTTLVTTLSCEKIKDKIISNISPFVYSNTQSFEIPAPIPVMQYTTPQQSETINLNQIIKDHSGLGLNVSNFSYIGLRDVTLHLVNGTDANNWANFEYIELQINTDKGLAENRPWLTARDNISTKANEQFSDKTLSFPAQNIKDYINEANTTIYYRFNANVIHPVTTPLKMDAVIRFEFKP